MVARFDSSREASTTSAGVVRSPVFTGRPTTSSGLHGPLHSTAPADHRARRRIAGGCRGRQTVGMSDDAVRSGGGTGRGTSARVGQLVAGLTVDEKASLTAGADLWTVPGVERLGI